MYLQIFLNCSCDMSIFPVTGSAIVTVFSETFSTATQWSERKASLTTASVIPSASSLIDLNLLYSHSSPCPAYRFWMASSRHIGKVPATGLVCASIASSPSVAERPSFFNAVTAAAGAQV